MQKQLEGTRSILMSSADESCPYRWATQPVMKKAIHTRFQRSINA